LVLFTPSDFALAVHSVAAPAQPDFVLVTGTLFRLKLRALAEPELRLPSYSCSRPSFTTVEVHCVYPACFIARIGSYS
jgi:hypothetical protein